ncbi:hypothetical protein ASG29_07990 [Sphingomonas sp. Leaf412]|uniref:fumarylacetoacetate hydrolase family protein n=1 Tax=Sphingomonas sp. Leaf412 TaxID=1736370 RepID=UPI0006F7C2B7|nr:fumarylacetoacetate hydrolase family protein [Sphingomonas sp. Leaf412]KQT31833.1 hypothetical protein ASG29_07990 [Sphingomonas sp. Leaf412]
MDTAFPPPPPILAPVVDGPAFPVGRVFCIGRNYADHAHEMGGDPTREAPFFFTKWAQAVVPSGGTIPYPPETADYQHEVELVVAIGTGGRDIAAADAPAHVFGHAVGLDMTRRDLQAAAKADGRPWDAAKNVEHGAPLGPIHPVAQAGHPAAGRIALTVNDIVRQDGDLSDMTWGVADLIAYLSRFYRLEPGDLIWTGTPAGVAAVVPGDVLVASIAGLSDLTVTIGERARG